MTNPTPVAAHNPALGVLMVIAASLFASTAGILLRQIDGGSVADGWLILFYRSISFAGVVFLFVIARNGRRTGAAFAGIGRPGIAVAVFLGLAFIAFIFALLLTTVAQATFILAASPFFAALLSRALLGEKIAPVTWAAIALAMIGVAVMLGEDIGRGAAAGSLIAVAACLGYAAAVVGLRAGKDRDMMPATGLSGVVAFLICGVAILARGGGFAVETDVLLIALALGTVQIGGQYILITLAARHLPAPQITLIMLLELVFAPLWVWIGVGEIPARLTLTGGAVVVAAVLLQTLWRRTRPARPKVPVPHP